MEDSSGVLANVANIEVSEFEIQSEFYVHFRTNSIETCMNNFITPPRGLTVPIVSFQNNVFVIK